MIAMSLLLVAAACALLAAIGHSYLSERKFLRPLRDEAITGSVFSNEPAKRLAVGMFHLASLCWAGMALSLLLQEPGDPAATGTLSIYAGIYAISGFGNFWIVGKPHPGGVLLLAASALILGSLIA